jgi:membrane complex biogenesis BtpA family protein
MKLRCFKQAKPMIGMIHVGALPGTPRNRESLNNIIKTAASEAKIYRQCGIDGIAIENMHDVPYLRGTVGPEITAAMTLVGAAVKEQFQGVVGVQVLAAANKEAIAVAHSAGLDWVRVEGFVFGHVADEGYIESCAAELLRYCKQIGAKNIEVWADIKKKHSSHAITADVSIEETAHAAEFMGADAIIVTGNMTGHLPCPDDCNAARSGCKLPVVIGSGINEKTVRKFLPLADGFIIGSYFKKSGFWQNGVDPKRVETLLKIARSKSD